VTREADTMGLMICLSQCSPSDLRALADASRYTGRLDTAEAALRVLHDRFPSQANAAAYLLGVVDEARGRNTSALRWYEEYLSRASTGSFVGEARAARLRMLVATGGSVAARDAARLYLEQYPQGSAARLATKVLEGR
jgi:tetratricopeptide (TPR) repeat protein